MLKIRQGQLWSVQNHTPHTPEGTLYIILEKALLRSLAPAAGDPWVVLVMLPNKRPKERIWSSRGIKEDVLVSDSEGL